MGITDDLKQTKLEAKIAQAQVHYLSLCLGKLESQFVGLVRALHARIKHPEETDFHDQLLNNLMWVEMQHQVHHTMPCPEAPPKFQCLICRAECEYVEVCKRCI